MLYKTLGSLSPPQGLPPDYQQLDDKDRGNGLIPHSETHPLVKDMMKIYYNIYDRILGKVICNKAGVQISDLRLGKSCLNYVLGQCNNKDCTKTRWHP